MRENINWILKHDGKLWIGYMWLRTGKIERSYVQGSEILVPLNAENFWSS